MPIPNSKELASLGKLAPLNLLSGKERKRLLQEVSIEHLNRGEYLFREGDTEPENVYLLSGKVALLKGEIEVETLMGNTETARFALAHQFPRQHAARAKTRVECVRINSHRLSELIENSRIDAYKDEQSEDVKNDDWKSLLLRSRIFQLIPRANIQHVINRMKKTVVRKDEEIIFQGEEGDYFYLISKGRCSVSQKSVDSYQAVEVAQLEPGDCFGEDALLSDNLRSSTVTMLTDGVLMRLSKGEFIGLIKHPLANSISFTEANKIAVKNGIWLDIRSPQQYQLGHLGGSINLPLNSLRFQMSSLVPGRQYIIYCQDGRYSAVAAYLLLDRGFDVFILSGGVKSIPEKMLSRRDLESQKNETKVVSLRPTDTIGSATHKQRVLQQNEADARTHILENRLLELRNEHEQTQRKLTTKLIVLEQNNAALKQQLIKLKSGNREQEVELEVLLATAQEQEQVEYSELKTLHSQLENLQHQLTAAEEDKEKALKRLDGQFKQSRMVESSSLLCMPDIAEMDKTIQQQSGDDVVQITAVLQEKEQALQSVLDRLEEHTISTLDAVDQEMVRQELEKLRAAIKERGYEMEQATLEQRSLEDALEDRDAHLEQIKYEMEQLTIKFESATMRYNKADEAHRCADAAAERLKEQLQRKQGQKVITMAEAGDGGSRSRQATRGVLSMLLGGLIIFWIINVLLVVNGKDEIIFSLSGETTVQKVLTGWLASTEVDPRPLKPQSQIKSIAKTETKKAETIRIAATSVVVPQPPRLKQPKVLRDHFQDTSMGPVMVEIPTGWFLMGSDRNALKRDEQPVHRVNIKRHFMGRYEITFEEYDRFAKATERALPGDQGWGRERRPVVNVTLDDAVAYAAWLSEQTGARYRLPTEAEWEYAAGAGSTSLYWWGYSLEKGQANCYNCGVKWAGSRTAPVGLFKANAFGLHNTAGNVMEWTQDCYHSNYVDAPTDGAAWVSSLCKQQVVRGGAYSKSGMSMRTTGRNKQAASSRLSILGFRLVRE